MASVYLDEHLHTWYVSVCNSVADLLRSISRLRSTINLKQYFLKHTFQLQFVSFCQRPLLSFALPGWPDNDWLLIGLLIYAVQFSLTPRLLWTKHFRISERTAVSSSIQATSVVRIAARSMRRRFNTLLVRRQFPLQLCTGS